MYKWQAGEIRIITIYKNIFPHFTTIPATPATMKKIDKRRLNELDSSTLVELIKDYMKENQELRRENMDLFAVRDMMLR